MSIFKGAAVAIITPMTETQEVNYEKLGELIEEQIAGGTDAIVICGTTGEASTLSHEEHLDAIKYTVEKVNHRIPVIAGTGSNSTETAIYLSQEAEKYGVDGLLLVSPYYNKATQKGLIAHFTAIADSVKVPVILYNIQGRTGVNIAPETIAYLFNNVENIVATRGFFATTVTASRFSDHLMLSYAIVSVTSMGAVLVPLSAQRGVFAAEIAAV